MHAVDLREHMGQQRMQPIVAQVQHAHVHVRQHRLHFRSRTAAREATEDLRVGDVTQSLAPEPEHEPFGEDRAHVLRVPAKLGSEFG